VVVLTTTIYPGGSTGWHSHPGPAFIVVIRGTLTVYDGDDPTCTPHRYGPGTGFVDPGFGHLHIARNEGTTPVTVVQTYLNVPPGGSPRIETRVSEQGSPTDHEPGALPGFESLAYLRKRHGDYYPQIRYGRVFPIAMSGELQITLTTAHMIIIKITSADRGGSCSKTPSGWQ
jgi:hypothetical protein